MPTATMVPQQVRIAAFAIWAMLGLLLLRVVLTFAFADELIDAWVADNETMRAMPREFAENSAPAYSGVAIGVLVVAIVLAIAAINLGKAARWGRVLAFVFAGLSLLGAVVSLIAPTIAVLLVVNVVVGLLAVAVIVLLCTGDANRFFGK